MSGIVIIVRFFLEVITVLGILYGAFQQSDFKMKILFIVIGISIAVLWYFFGAPKSAHALVGLPKLILEIVVYGIGIISFYYLFDFRIATTYTTIAVVDLVLMYILNLQGK